MKCLNCGKEFEPKRETAKYCSPNCRVTASRVSVTNNPKISVTEPKKISVTFRFKTLNKRTDSGFHETDDGKEIIREGKYWYDVPLGAVPVYEKGWPKMPAFMDGREYFLWWKNEFREKDGKPEIINPLPERTNVTYIMAGEQSRRWGA